MFHCHQTQFTTFYHDSNNLHVLKDIRLSENPIVDQAKGGIPRFVLIARLAKVKILNGSEVPSELLSAVKNL